MDNTFKSDFRDYLTSRLQASIEEHTADCPSYQKIKEKHRDYLRKTDKIVAGLPDSDRELIESLFDTAFIIHAEEEMFFYRQGMKDGIGILKELGVL